MEEVTFTEISRKLGISQSQVSNAYKTGMEKLLAACEEKGYCLEDLLCE